MASLYRADRFPALVNNPLLPVPMVGPADHCHVPRFILGAEVQAVDSWNRSQKLINIWSSACCDSATEQSPAFAWASWSSRPRRGPGRHPPRTTPWGAFLSPQAHSGFTDRWPLSSRPTIVRVRRLCRALSRSQHSPPDTV